MATATVSKVENPNNPTDLNLAPPSIEDASPTQLPPASVAGSDESKGEPAATETAEKSSDVDAGGAVTDVQKKMKRAERFGTPVNLSEEEKRNSRAERFGAGPATKGTDSSNQSEELKKIARAERFGVVKSTTADEEVKKKARLSRFGSSPPTDPAEEDKKKARALRFSQPDSSSKANGEGNIKANTTVTVASKAGGGT
ncbi:hypothetical protein CASFOL_013349 [Castilleja foliolosa]|uniref:THO1-MOS11 C-terminal domain-containing protein n=1 Tax=Castilleja foliolosa TaxID=1961234 RepID=A0ABD3DNL2_9LAMI